MARRGSNDRRYLELHGGRWRVTLSVPRDLHDRLGTRLKRSLNTDSLIVANGMKWAVVAELRREIDGARQAAGTDTLTAEAIQVAALLAREADPELRDRLEDSIAERAEELAGDPDEVEEGGERQFVHDPARMARAERYMSIARGKAVPLALYHADYLSRSSTKARTQADDRRALRYLETWCAREDVSPVLQAITRKRAAAFMDDLAEIAGGQHPVTLNKYLGRLSRYWQWLVRREHVEANVWVNLKLEAPAAPRSETERPFTDDEIGRLLAGPAKQAMADLMRIAALTGARLDPIVDLKVRDCTDGVFVFKPQKKEREARSVPIHPDLVEIVTRRTMDKVPDADVFPEWPPPRKEGSQRERSFKASNAFTAHRRSVGVEAQLPGKRRSLVNFHSFRRWFITKAEQADQPEHIIKAVVGHARQGMTLGLYSRGPTLEQLRRCVEAVRLPE